MSSRRPTQNELRKGTLLDYVILCNPKFGSSVLYAPFDEGEDEKDKNNVNNEPKPNIKVSQNFVKIT